MRAQHPSRSLALSCLLFLLFGISVAVLAGCKRQKPITVGSKAETEDTILAEIAAQHVENRLHRPVARRLKIGSTSLVNEAISNNEIDFYPEYSGIAQAAILRVSVVPDPEAVFERVQEMYLSNLSLDWLPPLGYQSPRVMVVRAEDARRFGLEVLSDAEKRPDGWALGLTYEFQQRPDGISAMNRAYHLIAALSPVVMDVAHLYTALDQKQVTMIPGTATDGFFDTAKYKALRDDRLAFPPYQPALVVRVAAEKANPELKAALAQLSGKITAEKIHAMNRAVSVAHFPVEKVAADFLKQAGLN